MVITTDVAKVLDSLGIEYSDERGEYRARCPMHAKRTGKEDHNPSFFLNAESGLGICFSCGYRCNLVGLVADVRGITFSRAEEYIEESPRNFDPERIRTLFERGRTAYRAPYDRFPESSLARFTDPPWWALERRHLDLETVSTFRVRWEQDGDEWVLPIRHAEQGYLLGWQVKSETRKGFVRNRPKSVRKSSTLFGVDVHNDPSAEVWLVESPLDAVRLYGLGIAALASFGSSVSDDQLEILSCYRKVVLAMDNDVSGTRATMRIRRDARPLGINIAAITYPDHAKDPGDLTDDEILDLTPSYEVR